MRSHLYTPIVRYSYILACAFIFSSCTYTKGPPEPVIIQTPPPDDIVYIDTLTLQIAPGDSAALDVNMDQVADIMIYGTIKTYITSSGSSGAHYSYLQKVRSINNNCRISTGFRNGADYTNFFTGTLISGGSEWNHQITLCYRYLTSFYGYWCLFPNEGYIGLELSQGQTKRYAWIKLESINGGESVRRLAINRTPGKPIKAGQQK